MEPPMSADDEAVTTSMRTRASRSTDQPSDRQLTRKERKRISDRRSQRNAREKTKQRMAELESTLQLLMDGDTQTLLNKKLQENRALQQENMALRARLQQISSLCQPSTGSALSAPCNNPSPAPVVGIDPAIYKEAPQNETSPADGALPLSPKLTDLDLPTVDMFEGEDNFLQCDWALSPPQSWPLESISHTIRAGDLDSLTSPQTGGPWAIGYCTNLADDTFSQVQNLLQDSTTMNNGIRLGCAVMNWQNTTTPMVPNSDLATIAPVIGDAELAGVTLTSIPRWRMSLANAFNEWFEHVLTECRQMPRTHIERLLPPEPCLAPILLSKNCEIYLGQALADIIRSTWPGTGLSLVGAYWCIYHLLRYLLLPSEAELTNMPNNMRITQGKNLLSPPWVTFLPWPHIRAILQSGKPDSQTQHLISRNIHLSWPHGEKEAIDMVAIPKPPSMNNPHCSCNCMLGLTDRFKRSISQGSSWYLHRGALPLAQKFPEVRTVLK